MSTAVAQLLSLLIAAGAEPPAAPAVPVRTPAEMQTQTQTPTPTPAATPVPVPAPGTPSDAETATVDVTPNRYTLTLGADAGATLSVTVHGPDAAAASPGRVFATVGTVESLVASGAGKPGSFTALYRAPAERYPQAAIVVAEVLLPGNRRVFGSARLALAAPTDLPLRTSPRAEVTVDVAGRVFGPRRADGEGRVRVPIVVPPGTATGLARATDAYGNVNETQVDLQPVEYPRALVIAPTDTEVGADIEVIVWGVTVTGDPAPAPDILLGTSAGRVERAGGGSGVARFTLTVPRVLGAGALALAGTVGGIATGRPHALAVRPGPAAVLTLRPSADTLTVGSGGKLTLAVTAKDRFGNLVPALGATLSADGRPLPTEGNAEGMQATVEAPGRWAGRERMDIAAAFGSLRAEVAIALAGTAPARLSFSSAVPRRMPGDGRATTLLVVAVVDERGTPTVAPDLIWETTAGSIEPLGSPRFGSYAARFVPARTPRDRSAEVVVTAAPNVSANARIAVDAVRGPAAVARIGILSNLGNLLGPAVFLEGLAPLSQLGRIGRLVSAGMSLGYLHGEIGTGAADAVPGVHLEVDQIPVLALARVRLPAELPIEFSLSGSAGVTFAATRITASGGSGRTFSRAQARGVVLGAGADAALLLHPGELVVGARYLLVDLGPTSDGDRLTGNTGGLIWDLGFKLGF